MKTIFKMMLFAVASVGGMPAHSAEFPSRPIRIVVPSTPGGALDVLVRLLSPKLTSVWNQQIVIDNRAGAAGIVGSEIVASAAPDGHTLLVVATGYTANPFLYQKLPYDTPKDFAPITILAWAPNVLVTHPSLPVKSVKDLIALAKDKPGQLNYASSGVGTGGHLSMALLARTTRIDVVHVPYKGAGAAVAAVVANQSQLLFTATGAAMPQIKSGRVRALAVTSAKRVLALPEVPTVAESGLPGYVVDGWYAILAPGKTPKHIVDRVYRDIANTLKMPDVAAQIESAGFEVGGIPPAEFARYIDRELQKWGAVIKEAGIKAE
jgi:tripartite-type tricarboxylate transporter receptor subunit TctC